MPAVGSTIMIVEASRWHRTFLRERQLDYHQGTRVMLELGELLPAAGYLEALQARELLRRRVQEAFERDSIDAILAPSTPITAPPIELAGELSGFVHHQLPANMTGQPSLSLPCGFDPQGLPVGLQIIGRPFAEETVFRIGQAYEEATDWHMRMPRIAE
jgi:aspartyl-tRNA(Asn)/glutamyl-tRNA(Gln) amidotransferase subunit A